MQPQTNDDLDLNMDMNAGEGMENVPPAENEEQPMDQDAMQGDMENANISDEDAQALDNLNQMLQQNPSLIKAATKYVDGMINQ